MRSLHELGLPENIFRMTGKLIPFCWAIVILCFAYGLWGGLVLAPADYQQGEAFRIIYIHVPFAFWSMGAYTLLAFFSAIAIIWRVKVASIMAHAIAPIGAWLTALALLTGAIWGKPMWGTWWVWDARLTSELLLLFIYWGYIGLHRAIPESTVGDRICAFYAVVGVVNIPIIHFSVNWWHTLHQGATLSRLAKPAIDNSMLYPLLAMIVGVGLYLTAMLLMRARVSLLWQERKKRWAIAWLKEVKCN